MPAKATGEGFDPGTLLVLQQEAGKQLLQLYRDDANLHTNRIQEPLLLDLAVKRWIQDGNKKELCKYLPSSHVKSGLYHIWPIEFASSIPSFARYMHHTYI